jgi:lipopolysaccharide export LptBFGC system permease protein LptF
MRLNKKNKILFLVFLITIFVCYSFAISNTIEVYREYYSKNELIINSNNSPKLANLLHQKEKQLDLILSQYNITASETFQNDLLKQLNTYSNTYRLKIIDFKEPHITSEKGFITTSYIFSLEGSFNGCLALLNKIENDPSLGSIKHLNFTKKRDYKTNTDHLFVEVIIQKNQGI